jgi:hypothetical protein
MSDWIRVTRNDPCPVCGKDTWCTYNDEVIICMRNAGGTEKTFRDGSVGWLHKKADKPDHKFVRRQPNPATTINPRRIMNEFRAQTSLQHLEEFGKQLGVSAESLSRLGCAWAAQHKAYAFPMFDGFDNTVGIRLRSMDGHKWAIKGSHQGIFKTSTDVQKRCYVCEGPTDTAAALTMGLWAIGRPHCAGGIQDIQGAFRAHSVREAVIVADNDNPGITGAKMLQKQLRIPSVILVLPCKDFRQALRLGLIGSDVAELVGTLAWHRP